MKTLYMHLGHGKTGSSFVQSSLALSVDNLAKHGIAYPISDEDRNLGVSGKISTGNAWDALETLQSFGAWLDEYRAGADISLLMSSERLFDRLHILLHSVDSTVTLDDLEEFVRRYGFDTVKVFFFTRDPEQFYSSTWQQRIKRSGETRPIEELHEDIGFRYIHVASALISALGKSDFFQLTVENYSTTGDVLEKVASWLEIDKDTLVIPPAKVINRGHTRAELELIRQLNTSLKCRQMDVRRAGRLSDAFCNELPDIPAEHARIPSALSDRLWSEADAALCVLNAVLPVDGQIRRRPLDAQRELSNESPVTSFNFNKDQLVKIAEFLATQIQTHGGFPEDSDS